MEGFGEQLLAHSGFALDQHRDVLAHHAAGALNGKIQALVAGFQVVEADFTLAPPLWGTFRDLVSGPAGRRRHIEPSRQSAAQRCVETFARAGIEGDEGMRVAHGTVDERVERRCEDHREVIVAQIVSAQPEKIECDRVDAQQATITGYRQQPLLHAADMFRARMEAQLQLAGVLGLEQPLFEQLRRKSNQAEGMALIRPVIAGNVDRPHHTALRIEDRRGAAGEEAVEAEEVLATEDFHRGLLDQRSADRIRTAQGLVPDCAWLQRDLLRTRDELRIAHTVNQHAAGVGEHHQAIRRPDLLVHMLHDALGVRDQAAVPLARFAQLGRRYHAVVTRNRAIGQSATTTSLPRAQHRVLYQFIRAASTIEEQFPRFVQTSIVNFQRQQGLSHPDSSMNLLYLFLLLFF